jgi:hypothetical protein
MQFPSGAQYALFSKPSTHEHKFDPDKALHQTGYDATTHDSTHIPTPGDIVREIDALPRDGSYIQTPHLVTPAYEAAQYTQEAELRKAAPNAPAIDRYLATTLVASRQVTVERDPINRLGRYNALDPRVYRGSVKRDNTGLPFFPENSQKDSMYYFMDSEHRIASNE